MTPEISGGGMFRYTGADGSECLCNFTLVETGMLSPSLCVLITSMRDNPGANITNMAAGIATEFVRAKLPGFNPDDILWIGHFPPGRVAGRDMRRRLGVFRVQWVPKLPVSGRPGYQLMNSSQVWFPLERCLQGERFKGLRACIVKAADEAESAGVPLDGGAGKQARNSSSGIYHFTGFHGCESLCRFTLFNRGLEDGTRCVLFTDTAQNKGTSITNAAESLATQFYLDILPEADPASIIWLEHYPPRTIAGEQKSRTLDVMRLQWVSRVPDTGLPGFQFIKAHQGWQPIHTAFREGRYKAFRSALARYVTLAEIIESGETLRG